MNKYIKQISDRIFKNSELSDFKNSTVLITGANGLIGGFLSDFFVYLNDEHDFDCRLVLTSLSDKPERLKDIWYRKRKDVQYYSRDLTNDSWFFEKIDYCFYCAGYAQPGKFLSNPFKTYSLNSDSMRNTLNSVFSNNKNAKALFLSSSEIYALNDNSESHKEDDVLDVSLNHKRISYILGKIAGECNVNIMRDSGYNVKSARVSLCYGPGHMMDDSRVMSDLTRKGIENDTIDLFDDGSSFRKYQHISDCCIMLINILLNGKEEVYNVGGKEEVTIYDMAKIIGDRFDKEVVRGEINNEVASSAPKKVSISLKRYENEFGHFDFTSFQDGMKNYLNWYENEILF
ncbi:hypothetical protein CMI47_08510 [Candidatus Pacearchaeota archaeon]|nr:hypothetical protein [Candidatus Pacearchaeota archaeon]